MDFTPPYVHREMPATTVLTHQDLLFVTLNFSGLSTADTDVYYVMDTARNNRTEVSNGRKQYIAK